MEAQTYLTEIPNNKQNLSSLPTKFTRLNQSQGKRAKIQLESFKKQKQHILTSLNNNINHMLSEQYYAVKKIKPGIGFYKIILQGEQKRKADPNIPFLNINLPKTLLFNQNSLQLLYSQNGIVKIKSQTNFNQFRKILNISEDKQVQIRQTQNKQIYSAALTGIGVGIFSDFSVSLSNQIDLRVLPRNQNQFSIKFIQPYADIPNMLRLFYIPKTIKNCKPNYAFKAINKKKLSQQISQKKHKLIYNYLVDFNKQNLIITTLVKGKALQQVQQMTQSIINYLQAIKRVKITEIVIDFIFGQDRLYYFHQLKSVKSVNQKNAWHIGDPSQFSLQYKQQTNQILCKLCGYFYPKIQISKSITNKLILQLLTHLRNRGQRLLEDCSNILKCNNNNNNINLSGISNVCDLCYQLIVAQHKLIDVQRSFLDIVNMGVDQIVRVKQIQNIKICQQQELGDMIQWRLFLYIQKVKNLQMSTVRQQEYILNMKFNDIKQIFTKKYKGLPFFNPSRLNSAKTTKSSFMGKSFVKSNHSRLEKKSTLHTTYTNRSNFLSPKQLSQINFQKIKLITFYTKTTDISQILQNQQIIFELSCKGQKYKGCSSTLKNFGNRKQCQRHTFQVLLFDNLYKYCNLEVSVGLICDNQVNMKGLEVRQSSNGRLWYLQKNSGTGCSPLPAEWMQIITQGLIPQQYSPIKANKQNQQQYFQYHDIYQNQCKSVQTRKYQNLNKTQQILQQNISQLKNMKKLDEIGFSSFF